MTKSISNCLTLKETKFRVVIMNESEILTLLQNYQNGTLSAQEKDKLDAWYLDKARNSSVQLNEFELEDSYQYLKSQLPLQEETKVIRLWPRVTVAASIVLLLGIGIFYYTKPEQELIKVTEKPHEIAPGGNRGILTLSNGKKLFYLIFLQKIPLPKKEKKTK